MLTARGLRNAKEYRAAVHEIDTLLDTNPRRNTEDYDRLEFLSALIESYEDEHLPWEEFERGGTPQRAVTFMLEQRGMMRTQLVPLMGVGGRSHLSEFFNNKAALSLTQVRALSKELGIPAELLTPVRKGKG
jgi:HTH-type transcriptional regulator/antitoxin HigA